MELTPEQARAAYDCLRPEMEAAYAGSGLEAAGAYPDWPRFSEHAYQSATHGQRYVQNFASPEGAEAYGRFEEVGRMPEGSILAKSSFMAHPDGALEVGPLFLMERLGEGASPDTYGWAYSMAMPDGTVMADADIQAFCAGCHAAVAEAQDSLFFMPEEVRKTGS